MVSQNPQGLSLLWLSSDPSALHLWNAGHCTLDLDGDRGWWQSSLLQRRLNLVAYCKEKGCCSPGRRREGGRERKRERQETGKQAESSEK